jgi:copper/silver efflux system protein
MNDRPSFLDRVIRFCLEQKLIVILLVLLVLGWGVAVAPFDWDIDWMPRDPIPVDAIPNTGENQQIVFTEWPGRSPQDIDDQVTYPLTVALLGVPGVKEVRSLSMFGFSSIFVIFDDAIEFYWSRARLIEKLGSLPAGTLPEGVQPSLGPDATGLGQIFWYTLEGRDPDGNPVGGWDLHELRTVQDWFVRYGLASAEGIAEVASVGGFVQEYQVDVDPDALRAYDVTVADVSRAIRQSNLDIGARVTEINTVEYIVRGVGFVKELTDLEQAVVKVGDDHVPILVRDVATVQFGPAQRRGAITIGGAEAVGGVVTVREGYNPLQAIHNVKRQIDEISPGLPSRAIIDWSQTTIKEVTRFASSHDFEAFNGAGLNHDAWRDFLRDTPRDDPAGGWPDWITRSELTIVPFYDRTELIYATLATLNDALIQQILVTILVVIIMLVHLRTAGAISFMLPMAVLMCFIGMKLFGVDANVVALAGIAIAIGTIVDMGLIMSENILRHLEEADPEEPRLEVVYRGATEVGSAVLTAIMTTVVSFLPVFALTGPEGKMFAPLAYTKTFVLIASVITAITVIPAIVHLIVARKPPSRSRLSTLLFIGLALAGLACVIASIRMGWTLLLPVAVAAIVIALYQIFRHRLPAFIHTASRWIINGIIAIFVAYVLANVWEPLGAEPGTARNFIFVAVLIGGVLGLFVLFMLAYAHILRFLLRVKLLFLTVPVFMVVLGLSVWLGFGTVFAFVPRAAEAVGMQRETITTSRPWGALYHAFPGLGREFLPRFDEGSFLWMPILSYHGSIGEALDVLKFQDMAMESVPEVTGVLGKIGRAETALDPAPVGMIESFVNYRSEYITDDAGRRITFRYDREQGGFVDEDGELLPPHEEYPELVADPSRLVPDRSGGGRPYRQWREHIRSPRDIWDEMVDAAALIGVTGASMYGPIEIRQVMIQSGMRATMGLKLRAPDLETLDRMAVEIERALRNAPGINPATVNADRTVGKPYLEIDIDRERIARYGLNITNVQDVIGVAIGGMTLTTTVEGRERYPVRVRYPRELRNDIEALEQILIPGMNGEQIPLREIADVRYQRGPQMIKSEDTFLVAYITFGAERGMAEVDVVEGAREHLQLMIERGELTLPAGVSYTFAGAYLQQQRFMETLRIVLPVSLAIIFLIMYLQFRSTPTTLIVFSGIAVAWAGGFIMIWFYGQHWFANFDVFGVNMRDTFQLHAINLSVAVWVGFLALFGIAVDDGVVMATYLKQNFAKRTTESIQQIREATIEAALRRVRPCLMTSATTILALLPVLTSTGKGADIMIPMAIPSVGGMTFVLITMFTVPVLYCLVAESRYRLQGSADLHAATPSTEESAT